MQVVEIYLWIKVSILLLEQAFWSGNQNSWIWSKGICALWIQKGTRKYVGVLNLTYRWHSTHWKWCKAIVTNQDLVVCLIPDKNLGEA